MFNSIYKLKRGVFHEPSDYHKVIGVPVSFQDILGVPQGSVL